jgi:hypothetical protein
MAELDFENEENKRLLLRLYAFSRDLCKKMFRQDPNAKGKSSQDYVHDAIFKHLADEDNFNGSAPLEYHLKYHLIQQAITNDLPLHIRKAYVAERKKTALEREMTLTKPVETALVEPDEFVELCVFISGVENEVLFKEIEKEISNDQIAEQIYLAVVYDQYSFSDRAEICADFTISNADFDNGKRRLMTALRNVFKKLKIEP